VDRLAIMDYLFVLLLNAIVRCNAAPTNANDLFSIIREILRCGSNSCPCTTEDVVCVSCKSDLIWFDFFEKCLSSR